ncbi:MAG: exodeoxyribonuclease III [Pseudolabrys sp.]|nr:exodeoxyribonuclease III [Pseudolabrys sp.]
MRVATWNVNSVKQRLDHLVKWLAERTPDVVCLQEIKCVTEAFPREQLEQLGYNVAVHGQKAFNGVALLSKYPIDEVASGLMGDDADVQARFIEAVVSTKQGAARVVSLYLPNGNPVGTEKFSYKLKWMDRLIRFSSQRLQLEEPLLLCGDFNIIPTPQDAHYPAAWVNDALFQPESRERFRALANLGFTDAIRATSDGDRLFTFWDYQAGAFQRDHGIRIDHIMLSPQAADRLTAAGIDKHVRGWEKPSDHVPVWVDLNIDPR